MGARREYYMSDTNPEVTPMSDLSDDELVQAAFDLIIRTQHSHFAQSRTS